MQLTEKQKAKIKADAIAHVKRILEICPEKPRDLFDFDWTDSLVNSRKYSGIIDRYGIGGNAKGWLELLHLYELTCNSEIKRTITRSKGNERAM